MTQDHPRHSESNTEINITSLFIVCLIGLLLVWSTGVSVPQLWRDAMQSIGSGTAPGGGIAHP